MAICWTHVEGNSMPPFRVYAVLVYCFFYCIPLQAQNQVIFEDDFETGVLGPQWTAAASRSEGITGVFTTVQGAAVYRSGEFGVALGQAVDGVTVTNTLDLTLDLASYENVTLEFDLYNSGDETDVSDGLYFSTDGGIEFTKVFDFDPSTWNGGWGKFPPFDLDLLAGNAGLELSNGFIIRIQHTGNSKFVRDTCCDDTDGFFLDNVKVIAEDTKYAGLPFFDGFEDGAFGDSWRWVHPGVSAGTAPINSIRLRGTTRVDVTLNGVSLAYEDAYGLVLGRIADGNLTSNAVDLHLDLAGESDVKLAFRMLDRNDETHVYDGLYFSDDGGTSFSKVLDFRGSSWADAWGMLPPLDVDALAASVGLSLSSTFVVRFQQYDNSTVNRGTCCDDIDGLILDNVQVYSRPVEYVSIPFEDDFEEDGLHPAWQWTDATFPLSTTLPNTTVPTGFVTRTMNSQGISVPQSGLFGIVFGRSRDEIWATNALDLHLNLAGEEEVDLSFYLYDRNDEQHVQDGIFFSDDGGQSFTRVYRFLTSSISDFSYRNYTLDVDALAEAFELDLTGQFIIRFQEYDQNSLVRQTCCDDIDGFFLDNVYVDIGEPGIAVWPGDANNDGRVNQADILPVGLYWGNQGPARAGFEVDWFAQSVSPWAVPVATYADTDGSGEVDEGDILPIGMLWGNERGASSKGRSSTPDFIEGSKATLSLVPIASTSETVEVSLMIEQAEELIGIAYKLNYPPDKMRVREVLPGTYLGQDIISFTDTNEPGLIASAFSRKGRGSRGQGEVARIVFEKLTQWETAELSIVSARGSHTWGRIETLAVPPAGIAVSTENLDLPINTTLEANYPNPFQASTEIVYNVAGPESVEIAIYDIMGKHVRTILQKVHSPGTYSVSWDGRNDAGEDVATGVYILTLRAGTVRLSQSIMRIR